MTTARETWKAALDAECRANADFCNAYALANDKREKRAALNAVPVSPAFKQAAYDRAFECAFSFVGRSESERRARGLVAYMKVA